ncbi:MAG TPA: ABC transporter ATP-binding protein [Candidatus Ozemobacteraceae bacterium]|nr:ABC transporter ATP-binding protein [Candidatus Ozemobacteraceae bacterium]
MSQTNAALILDQIWKKYGQFEAVKGVSLEIPRGELFGFLGPNGAGKTTLIRIINGILQPTSGRVVICGHDLDQQPEEAKRSIGYIPDRPYLYEKLTPLEYFEFIAGLYSIPAEQYLRRGEEMLNRFSMWEWRNELIESFSHGMKQKIAMTASILHDPDLLVVDEPMVGLDPRSVRLVKDFFLEMVKTGKTIFLTTHTLSVAESLCHRIGIINRGQVVAMGSMDDLRGLSKGSNVDLESVFLKLTEEESDDRQDTLPPGSPCDLTT